MNPLFFLFIAFSALASAEPINCNQFWANAASEPPFRCELYTRTGYPKKVGGAEMRIYHYSDGWNNETGQLELLGAVTEAIEQAIPLYAKYAAIPRMSFVFYNEISNENYAVADWQLSNSTEACRVRLFFNIPNDRDLAKQIVAHEIFHCVQRYGIVALSSEENDGALASARWWVEGSAEFYSSLVAPNGNGEINSVASYRPSLPLYHQPNPYSPALFFHGIENSGFTPESIVALLKGQPALSTFAAERSALSKNQMLADAFHNFARYLVDKKVTGAYGKAIPQPDVPAGPALEIDPALTHVGLSVVPFTMNRALLHFPAGTTKTLSLAADAAAGKVQLSMRKRGESRYMKLEQGATRDIQVMCNDEKGADYDFIFTSTRDSAEAVSFTLEMQGGAPAQPCKCEDSALPVDKCLLGNWKLDNNAFMTWLHTKIAPSFYSAMVQGNENFRLEKTHTAHQIFQDFQTTLTILVEGKVTPWTQTKVNGQIDYQIIQRKTGNMCLRRKSASGTSEMMVAGTTSTSPLASVAEGMDPDRDLRVVYQCKPKSLVISSEENSEVPVEWVYDKVTP